MFKVKRLKKWIELEITELDKLEKVWSQKKDCEYNIWACQQQKIALEGVLYILKYKKAWINSRGHGVFKGNE